MKSFLATLACLFILVTSTLGQMTYEHSYGNPHQIGIVTENGGSSVVGAVVVNLAVSGKKIAICDSQNLYLYNTDYSLWKTISLPVNVQTVSLIFFISENLFKLDNKVEFGLSNNHTFNIMDEDGNVLNNVTEISNPYWMWLYHTAPDTTKAIITNIGSQSSIYSLPGNLPCEQCSNNAQKITTISQQGPEVASASPNPTNGITTIGYTLPLNVNIAELSIYNTSGQVVKSYPIDVKSKSIKIDLSSLPAAAYYYSMQCDAVISNTQPIIVVR